MSHTAEYNFLVRRWYGAVVLGPVERVDEVDSTNRVLLDRARAGAPEGIVLVADRQTAGRGRLDRRWVSPPGACLLVSVLLRPTLPIEQVYLLSVCAGLAARDACAEVAGVEVGLKWPNDLVVDTDSGTAKLAGILAESVVSAGRVEAVVVGMGLNVRWDDDLPDTATALDRLSGRSLERDDVLDAWVSALTRWYEQVQADPAGVVTGHRSACTTLGRDVQVELPSGLLEGRAVDVTPEGHLVVDTADGRRAISVGDVVHLRPR
jgi:BirA family biotin operon repressor/biotin-[acetyl-CoA-carboxylase] ligase